MGGRGCIWKIWPSALFLGFLCVAFWRVERTFIDVPPLNKTMTLHRSIMYLAICQERTNIFSRMQKHFFKFIYTI